MLGRQHDLKCKPEYFARIATGQKTFEIRKNDRDFQVGDILILLKTGTYDCISAEVVYMTDFEQKPGYVVLGIKVLEPRENKRKM